MAGGVPPWTWPELGPMVADLDALYVNFISGFELDRATARLLRQGFPHLIYADLHSLFLGMEADGTRVPQPLPEAPSWFGCFDYVQVNEEEMAQLGGDALAAAAGVLSRGARALVVTLGARGAVYFTGRPVRSARVAAPADVPVPLDGGDPTGCGDVLGAAVVAGLLHGEPLDTALARATRLAARNVSHRGASGLRDHLLGRLSAV
jgi:sugar/nucleoside kinase (ribokinase family)